MVSIGPTELILILLGLFVLAVVVGVVVAIAVSTRRGSSGRPPR